MRVLMLALALLALSATAAAAQTESKPLLSFDRLSMSLGAQQVWHERLDGDNVGTAQRFEFGLFGAYDLVPRLALVGSAASSVYDGAQPEMRYTLGARYVIKLAK